mmetsp:Transcript_12403/g.10679  ORF Transcript_12403/g.10679 Transcript_12403/m.10679 type:complete len:157 (-) Transcript_12403:1612-2082(-)
MLLCILLNLIDCILTIYTITATGMVIDAIANHKPEYKFHKKVMHLISTYVIQAILQQINIKFQDIYTSGADATLKESFCQQILSKDIDFFDARSVADIANKFDRELREISAFLNKGVFELVARINQIIVSFCVLYSGYPVMTSILISFTLIRFVLI